MRSLLLAIMLSMLVAGVALADSAATSAASFSDASEAAEQLIAADDEAPDDAVLVAAAEAIEKGLEAEPRNDRLQFAMALVAMHREEWKEARKHIEKAIKANPRVAEYHYRLGNFCFADIQDAGMLGSVTQSSKGKKAYLKAIKLDPDHAGAHIAIAFFYSFAPGIAGGSTSKAREHALIVTRLEESAHMGHIVLASLAGKERDWAAADKHFDDAYAAATDPESRRAVRLAEAQSALMVRKDAGHAAEVLTAMIERDGVDDDRVALYLLGQAHKSQGDCETAIEEFRRVLAHNPSARGTRIAMAECLETVGRPKEAAEHYAEFAWRFTEDDRAKDARKNATRLIAAESTDP